MHKCCQMAVIQLFVQNRAITLLIKLKVCQAPSKRKCTRVQLLNYKETLVLYSKLKQYYSYSLKKNIKQKKQKYLGIYL